MRPAVLPAFLAMCSLVLCQGTIFVPDNQSNAGTCNAIPLSASFAAASTYVARIPASYMDPMLRRIDDIAFAPCANATFSAPNLQMGLGHVPTPLPVPFAYPTFDAAGNVTALGSFLDYHPIWNSGSQGPFTYPMTMDTWSPMGFATGGGTIGFTWNGTNDVGYYLTYSGATGGDACHRTSTEPYRSLRVGHVSGRLDRSLGRLRPRRPQDEALHIIRLPPRPSPPSAPDAAAPTRSLPFSRPTRCRLPGTPFSTSTFFRGSRALSPCCTCRSGSHPLPCRSAEGATSTSTSSPCSVSSARGSFRSAR